MLGKFLKTAGGIALAVSLGVGGAQAELKPKLGHAMPEDHPQATTMIEFAKRVKEYSNGKIDIQLYHGSTLGGDDKMLQATQSGTQEIYYGSFAPISGRVKELQIFDFPFLFDNYDEIDAVFYGPIGDALFKKMEPLNLIGLGWAETGFRQLSNNKREVKTVDDLKGLKIRVMQNPVALETWKSMNTNAVPMSFAEVFTALETGALDGQENPLVHMYSNKMYEVQKYITITNHVYTPCGLMVSKRFWDTLTPEDHDALRKAADEAVRIHRTNMLAADKEVVEQLRGHGVSVEALPPAELAKLREMVKPVVAKFTPTIGEEFVKSFYAEIDKARAQKK